MDSSPGAARILAMQAATRNRGQMHVIMGDPWSDLCDKTVVEPGGNFSPGVWTCGVSVWVEVDGVMSSPDLLAARDIVSSFGETGSPPVLRSSWPAGSHNVTTEVVSLGGHGAEGADFLRISLAPGNGLARAHLVVRGEGPAGGKLTAAAWQAEADTLTLQGGTRLSMTPSPDAVHIERSPEGDVAVVVTWPEISADESWSGGVCVEHAFLDRPGGDLIALERPYAGTTVDQGIERARIQWVTQLPARVFAPDPAIGCAWEQNAFHLIANAETGVPRIGTVDYPVLWIRDAVIQVGALDAMGRHDLARAGCEQLASVVFSGGFGAEADAPGQAIWALVQHARLTQDPVWLRTVYPAIVERAHWLDRMRTAVAPLRAPSMNRMPRYLSSPAINTVCLPAEGGLIRGRMDWQLPGFYVNCWAVAGYRSAAYAARVLRDDDRAAEWERTAEDLDERIAAVLLPAYGNERDPAVAPYPTDALRAQRDDLTSAFAAWYRRHRLTPDGDRAAEPLWTYFEAAQAHNALRSGLVDEAWVTLQPMLDPAAPWALGVHGEGVPGGSESLPFGRDESVVGWLDPARAAHGNMPHGWTAAELVNALRSVFVVEEEDGLVIGSGVPARWCFPGAVFGVENLPTRWGAVSFTVTVSAAGWSTDVSGDVPWRLATPVMIAY